MIKPKDEMNLDVEIDLTGPDGNAFVLMGYAKNWARELEYEKEEIDAMIADMKSSDYEHLLSVLEQHFGEYVTFYR
jgi:hypothetical protein